MPSTCNDCGAAFKGDVKGHIADAHPGLPRGRFRDDKGVNHLVCLDCGHTVIEGQIGGQNPHLQRTKAETTSGKSFDPIDYFDVHLQTHRQGED